MSRLRTTKKLTLSLCKPIDDIPKPKLRIMLQNVQSLRKYFDDVKCNKEFQSADVLLFCETWLDEQGTSSDNFNIEGFKTPMKVRGWNKHRGLIIYSKKKMTITPKIVDEHFELMHLFFNATSLPYSIILFYRPPSSNNVSELISTFESIIMDPRRNKQTYHYG